MNIKHLAISWTTSRGRDTYGYNICRLDDRGTGSRFKTCGGGYDMIGTVFGDWLEANYQDELKSIGHQSHHYTSTIPRASQGLYGFTMREDVAHLNGACGIESMIRIAEAIGLEVQREGNKKGHTIGFYITKAVTA